MALHAILDLRIKPELLAEAPIVLARIIKQTRSFDGCISIDVLIDEKDETHWLVLELWESAEHDAAYRAFRAGPGAAPDLRALLEAPPALTKFALDTKV